MIRHRQSRGCPRSYYVKLIETRNYENKTVKCGTKISTDLHNDKSVIIITRMGAMIILQHKYSPRYTSPVAVTLTVEAQCVQTFHPTKIIWAFWFPIQLVVSDPSLDCPHLFV